MIKLREVTEEDLDIIHSIELDVYPVAWSKSFFKMMYFLKNNMFIAAVDGEEVLGYCVGEIEKMGKDSKPVLAGHVLNIAVSKNHQKEGIGTILLDEIEGRFMKEDATVAYLEVRESNIVAQTMYRKRGYQYVRTSKDYYGDEDGFIMMKSLTR